VLEGGTYVFLWASVKFGFSITRMVARVRSEPEMFTVLQTLQFVRQTARPPNMQDINSVRHARNHNAARPIGKTGLRRIHRDHHGTHFRVNLAKHGPQTAPGDLLQ
jgi:hypothetical protein